MQESFENDDPSFNSKALNFVSILNDVNKEEPTTIKGSIDYYSQRAKEIFDGWFK